MNFLMLFIECVLVYFSLLLFYRFGKKNGLFLFIGFMSILISLYSYELIDILGFSFNSGLPLIMGIFTASNIIIQRFGIDEIKRIVSYFAIPYVSVFLIICLGTLIPVNSGYSAYDILFGYNLDNLRLFVGGFLSIFFMLYLNGEIYYYIRRSRNNLFLSNISSMFIIQFIESFIFVLVSYLGNFDWTVIVSMIIVRYLLKVIFGMIGLGTVHLLVIKKGK